MAASNQNNGGAMLIGIITGAVKVNVGGRTLSAQDRELRWGENGKPEEKDAAEIFSATVGLRPDQNTLIKVHKREQAVPVSPVQQLELSLRPEQDKLRAWITLPQHESLPDLPMCLNILLPTRQNQWQAAIFSVSNPRGTKPGVFLLFYKVQTATPDLLKQVETGDTGDCVVTRAAAESPDGVYATAEFKIIDLPQAEFQKIAAVLEPPVAPANGVSRLSPVWRATSVEAMEDLLDQSKGELVSAPRVTFRVTDGSLKIVQRGQYPISDVLEGSEAFLKFWGEGMPTAIIADLRSEMFVDRSKKLVQLSEGLIAAIGATQTNEDTLDVRLFVEDRRLKRHKRGLAFWKPRRLPEVAYAPVESHFVSGYGNTVVLEAPTPKPDARRLVMLTIDKAETGPRFFEAGYNAGTN